MEVKRESKIEIAKRLMTETTAHGIDRLGTNKSRTIRGMWLLLVMAGACGCVFYIVTFIQKLQSGSTSSTTSSSSVPFIHPDFYFCVDDPLSGSYYLHVNQSIIDEVQSQFNQFDQQVAKMCTPERRQNNTEVICSDIVENIKFVKPNLIRYELLANELARRRQQSVLESILVYSGTTTTSTIEIPVEEFLHPSHLRCFVLKLNSIHEKLIRDSLGPSSIQLVMMIDGFSEDMHQYYNQTGLPPMIETKDSRNFTLYPPQWLFSSRFMFETPDLPTVRVYPTPPGDYPSSLVPNFALSAGRAHVVTLDMTKQEKNPSDFEGQCTTDTNEVYYLNPLTKEPNVFENSLSYCYHYVVHKTLKNILNVSIPNEPMPYVDELIGLKNFYLELLHNDDMWDEKNIRSPNIEFNSYCKGQDQCTTLSYTKQVNSLVWPTESTLDDLQLMIENKVLNQSVTDTPALHFVLNQLKENKSAAMKYLEQNAMKIIIKTERKFTDVIQFSLAYKLENFAADVGGILGLYLGMSILTAFELIELIISFIENSNFCIKRRAKYGDADQSEENGGKQFGEIMTGRPSSVEKV